MSQNDYIIANQTAPAFRADLNDALQALASLSSGTSQPATTYANMLWYDTGNNILKMRTEANDAWMNIGYLDQTANAFRLLDDTQVVNTSGSQTGLIGDQTTATWETGTGTTESLVSPAKVKAAIEALVPDAPTAYGAVGTYATAFIIPGSSVYSGGDTISGSSLRYFDSGGEAYPLRESTTLASVATTPSGFSGTWRLMGGKIRQDNSGWGNSALWLRIS